MKLEEVTQVKKSYRTVSGPFAWLADIEIARGPYLASFGLLILGMVLVRLPFYEVTAFGVSVSLALHEVPDLEWASTGVMVLNVVSLATLVFPMLKYFEWKYMWFVPTAVAAVVELSTAVYLVLKVKDVLANSAIGIIYDYLSVEIYITFSGWLLLLSIAATLICSIKMLIDISNNERIY